MGQPYGGTASIDSTGESVDVRKSFGSPAKHYLASKVEIINRVDSADAVDVSLDGGGTYTRRLNQGQSMTLGGANSNVKISTIYLKCASSTATIEWQAEYIIGVPQ
jgi:hypothetical protein